MENEHLLVNFSLSSRVSYSYNWASHAKDLSVNRIANEYAKKGTIYFSQDSCIDGALADCFKIVRFSSGVVQEAAFPLDFTLPKEYNQRIVGATLANKKKGLTLSLTEFPLRDRTLRNGRDGPNTLLEELGTIEGVEFGIHGKIYSNGTESSKKTMVRALRALSSFYFTRPECTPRVPAFDEALAQDIQLGNERREHSLT